MSFIQPDEPKAEFNHVIFQEMLSARCEVKD